MTIFGNDYDTKDGTGVRDYIHILDLAEGHIAALNYSTRKQGLGIFNLGTGTGYTVLEIVAAMEKASGKTIPLQIKDRRVGDVAACFADPSYAKSELGWEAKHGIDAMCKDLWNFIEKSSQK